MDVFYMLTTIFDYIDYRPVALTSTIMKCFERLAQNMICSSLPDTRDPLQFAYRANRSRDDAISHVLHSTLPHLDKGGYVRLLFLDYSSAFNTIVPQRLTGKLRELGLNPALCSWVQDFLTNRPQVVRMGEHTSSSRTLNIGAPQGCVLSPLLYSLYTQDCTATHTSNTIVKFADDTVVVGLISNNNVAAYYEEVALLANWCQENNLVINVSKTKEMVVDMRRGTHHHAPLNIHGATVERVPYYKYLGVNISEDMKWEQHISAVVKQARQRLYHLRKLRQFNISARLQKNFYCATVEPVLTGCMTVWYEGATERDKNALRRVVRSAERITRTSLLHPKELYQKDCVKRAQRIMADVHHPHHGLFQWLPSGRRLRTLRAGTERFNRSFIPQAIRLMNTLLEQKT